MEHDFIISRHYVPYHLALEKNKVFRFNYKTIEVAILINEFFVNAEVEDLNNIITHKKGKYSLKYSIEKNFSQYTDDKLNFIINSNDGTYLNSVLFKDSKHSLYKQKFKSSLIMIHKELNDADFSDKALIFFLNSYEYVSDHIVTNYLESPYEVGVINSVKIIGSSLDEVLMKMNPIAFSDFRLKKLVIENFPNPPLDKKLITEKIDSFLSTSEEISIVDEFLLNAKKQLNLHNYKFSFLESFFALEILVSTVVYKHQKLQGMSRTKLKKLEKEPLEDKIKKYIKSMLMEKIVAYGNLINEIHIARKIRNDIVHKSLKVSKDDAMKFNPIIKQFINLIKTNLL